MNNTILLYNAILIKESSWTSLMTLLPALQHGLLDMLFQCCFCGQNLFNWAALLCIQDVAALIHRNTWTSYIAQENNKLLNTLKIFITNTGSHRQSKIKGHHFHHGSKTKSSVKRSICCRLMHVS